MPRGSWHWLDLLSDNVLAHVVRTKEADAFPEDTPNCQDRREINQGDLFKDDKIIEMPNRRLYAWLCYGATRNGALSHVCWGMPSAKQEGKEDAWLARINLMLVTLPKRSEDDIGRPGKVDPKTWMRLRDQVNTQVPKIKSEEK